jgi:hypothetical protein
MSYLDLLLIAYPLVAIALAVVLGRFCPLSLRKDESYELAAICMFWPIFAVIFLSAIPVYVLGIIARAAARLDKDA